jgi:hypothetical protein
MKVICYTSLKSEGYSTANDDKIIFTLSKVIIYFRNHEQWFIQVQEHRYFKNYGPNPLR